jgi:hypothetical protein
LYRVRDALGIRENDAFWYIVMILEHYDSLYDSYPVRMAQAAEQAIERARGAFQAAAVAESATVRRLLAEEVGRRGERKPGGELAGVLASVGVVLAIVVMFGAVCVRAGFALASPGSSLGGGDSGAGSVGWRLFAGMLRVPAGWMAFALLLPGMGLMGRMGLRLAQAGESRAERASGWGIVGVSAAGGLACVVVLASLGAGG